MKKVFLLLIALAVAMPGSRSAEAHIIVFKVCLDETVEAASTPLLVFDRRPEARKAGTYAWNARTSDKYGGQYADHALSNDTRSVCSPVEAGGFQCVMTGAPCREVTTCEEAGSRPCYEFER